jgi:hypothetical protein
VKGECNLSARFPFSWPCAATVHIERRPENPPEILGDRQWNGKKFIDQAQLVEADRVIVKAAEIYED